MNIQVNENAFSKLVNTISSSDHSLGEIAQKLNTLNETVNNQSAQILSLIPSNQNFWIKYSDSILSGIFGIIGVLVGTFIAYYFNKRIQNETAVARIAIQKKNLIYNPLYKELLSLNKYTDEQRETCYLKIFRRDSEDGWGNEYHFNRKRISCGKFMNWYEIKKDIRLEYIPSKIRQSMDKIDENIENYNTERNKIEKRYAELYKKLYDDKLESIVRKINSRPGEIERPPVFLFKKGAEFSEKYFTENRPLFNPEYSEIKDVFFEFCKTLTSEIERANFFNSYDVLTSSINHAYNEVKKLIDHIINKYEYGEELEKYE